MGYRKAKAATEIDVPTVGATTNAPAIPTFYYNFYFN